MLRHIVLLLVGVVALMGCEPPSSSNGLSESSIRPPAWIQGTWQLFLDAEIRHPTCHTFTRDDIQVTHLHTSWSFTEGYQGFTQWAQTVTQDTYSVTGKTGGSSQTYTWKKVSANSLAYQPEITGTMMTLTKVKDCDISLVVP